MSKRIIRDRAIVADDWTRLDDTTAVPASGKVIVSHARWVAERDALLARAAVPGSEVGVAVPSSLDPAMLASDLPKLALVAVDFSFIQPKPEGGRTFDGRAYSQARLLRERFGFTGEIRAVGGVFRDAMYYMARCGVNAFELPDAQLEDAVNAFKDFSFGYVGAADDPTPIFRRRRA